MIEIEVKIRKHSEFTDAYVASNFYATPQATREFPWSAVNGIPHFRVLFEPFAYSSVALYTRKSGRNYRAKRDKWSERLTFNVGPF